MRSYYSAPMTFYLSSNLEVSVYLNNERVMYKEQGITGPVIYQREMVAFEMLDLQIFLNDTDPAQEFNHTLSYLNLEVENASQLRGTIKPKDMFTLQPI